MKACSVEGCKGPCTPDPVFFEFPSSRLLRKRWLDAINCPSAGADATVCIRHFNRTDYDLVRGETRLKTRSVPSRRIRDSIDAESEPDSGTESDTSSASEVSDAPNDVTPDKKKSKIKNNKEVKDDKTDNKEINHDNTDNKQINIENTDNRNITNENNLSGVGEHRKNDSNIKNRSDYKNDSTERMNIDNLECRLSNDEKGIINENNEKTNAENEKLSGNNETVNDTKKITKNKEKVDTENDDNLKRTEDNEKIPDNPRITKDNEKIIDSNGVMNEGNVSEGKKPRGNKTRCKVTAMRPINGRRRSYSSDSTNSDSVSNSPRPLEPDAGKEDIEESLQHYYIENKKTERQVAAMTDVMNEQESRSDDGLKGQEAAEPVYIELSVGQGSTKQGQDPAENDCLMLLESVQCDIDPTLMLAAREEDEANMEHVDLADDDDDDDDDEIQIIDKKKEDPISLLTSSDEDDVIIQEPKYDLVEVSSADTSEDDVPLVKLVKPSGKPDAKKMKNLITKLLWGGRDYYCVQCGFSTSNSAEYTTHMAVHNECEKIIQYCHDCGFTTSSKHQMQKHKKKHKTEKRFKCQLCNYAAKHKMSLLYHMKTHKNSGLNEVELAICGTFDPSEKDKSASQSESATQSESKSERRKSEKRKGDRISESDKRYKCNTCGYKTNRKSDLLRHRRRKHEADDDDEDEEYVP